MPHRRLQRLVSSTPTFTELMSRIGLTSSPYHTILRTSARPRLDGNPTGRGRIPVVAATCAGAATITAMPDRLHPLWVESADGVVRVAEACHAAGRFALDTEADSLHSYFHKVCLIQVSADERHALIDPLAIDAGALRPLWDVVGDPEVPVLMHGADYDIRVLDRDYGARVRGLEDTQIMAQLLGESKTGLAALLERDVGVTLDKKHQRADWGRRPLGRELREYAAADTAYLERLAAGLRQRLETLDRWSWAEEEFRRLEQVRYAEPATDDRAFERLKGVGRLRGAARDRAFTLYEWREDVARRLDLPPFKVLGNRPLLELAEQPSERFDDLPARDGLGPRFARRWGREVIGLLESPRRAPDRVRSPRQPSPPEAMQRRLQRLTAVRDGEADRLGLPGGLLCPKATLTAIAELGADPTREALRSAGLEGWRFERLADGFLDALRAT